MASKDYYKIENSRLVRLKKICPKCENFIFLADHKDRLSCGKCGYFELKN